MEGTRELKSLKLGTQPVGKLILKMSAPAMISMLVQALYNTVDSIFVGRATEAGLTALSLAYPMQMLVLAFAIGIGVGTNSLIARRLGEGKYEEASRAAQNGVFLAACAGLMFAAVGYFLSKWFIGLYTDDPVVYEMGYKYLAICVCCSILPCVEIAFNRILQAMGNMIVPMICQLAGALTNIILDPIMIFGLLGCPAMGVTGAAVATVVGQGVALLVAFVTIILKGKTFDIKIFSLRMRPSWESIKQICAVGLPSLILNAIGSVMFLTANFILIKISVVAVAVFGIFYKLQSLVFMPTFGMNQGIMPILGYNYGANNKARFNKTLKISLISSFCIMTMGFILFQTIPAPILSLFNASEELTAVGVPALRICSACFIPASAIVILVAMFNAIGHGVKAMLMSLLRQLGILLPVGYLLSRYIGVVGFWAAFPIAETIVLIIFIPIAIKTVRKIFRDKEAQLPVSEDGTLIAPEPKEEDYTFVS